MNEAEKEDAAKFNIELCAGTDLAMDEQQRFNNYDKEDGCRSFITTQSVKKLKANLKKWALDPEGWHLPGGSPKPVYDIWAGQIERAEKMPAGVEVAKVAIDDFKKIQRYMQLAKKENATETYAELKEE